MAKYDVRFTVRESRFVTPSEQVTTTTGETT
jgi:hypothetical protein